MPNATEASAREYIIEESIMQRGKKHWNSVVVRAMRSLQSFVETSWVRFLSENECLALEALEAVHGSAWYKDLGVATVDNGRFAVNSHLHPALNHAEILLVILARHGGSISMPCDGSNGDT